MKTRPSSRPSSRPAFRLSRGFTLVELLVVIAIIIVLAAAGFSAGSAAMAKAKRLKAQSTVTALETAVNQFYGEYGRLPDVGENVNTSSGRGVDLLTILLGKEASSSTVQNTKQINYLNGLKEGKNSKDGLIYGSGGSTPTGLYDAWGNGYELQFDVDYDEEITDPIAGGNVLRGRRVLVYTLGADKKKGGTDDVKSW